MRRVPGGQNETGAVLVETALVSMFLLIVIAGILEYGTLFASTIDTSSGVRSAARVGSITTADGPANDWQIIRSLVVETGAQRANIERVVIYEANSTQTKPSTKCMAGSPAAGDVCNVYDSDDLTLSQAQLSALGPQRRWPESLREPGIDNIGVWVQMKHPRLFNNLIPAPAGYSDGFTMPITPVKKWAFSSGAGPGSENPGPWSGNWQCHNGACVDLAVAQGGSDNGGGGGS